MNNLDGKELPKPTPFDAHEQVVRGPHFHTKRDGYQPLEEQSEDEYPKVIGYSETDEPIIAKSERHEGQLLKEAEEKPVVVDEAVTSLDPVAPLLQSTLQPIPPVPAAPEPVIPIAEDPAAE